MCPRHGYWHRGTNLARISTHGQMWHFIELFTIFSGLKLTFVSRANINSWQDMFPRKAIPKNRPNYFHGCCFSFCYWPLTDVNCDCRYGSPFPSFPNLITFLDSPVLLMRAEVVQDCERFGTCWRFWLWSSVRPGYQSPVFLLQRPGHTADVRMSQGTHIHTNSPKAFECSPCHFMLHILHFLLLCHRWQIWPYITWQVELSTCENLMWVAAFSSRIALFDTWRGSALHSAPSRWPTAPAFPSKTQT